METKPSRKWLCQLAALALLYYAGAMLGFVLAIERTHSAPLWPPAGIALAGLIVCGWRVWPGVWLGAFAANWVIFNQAHAGNSASVLWCSGLIASGNTLEALAAWFLCTRWLGSGGESALGLGRSILFGKINVFQFAAVTLATSLVSAAVGPATVCALHFASWQDYRIILFTWWSGDSFGMLYATPFLLAWLPPFPSKQQIWLKGETAAAFGVLLLCCALVCFWYDSGRQALALKSVIIAPMLWIAIRIGLRATAAGLLVLAIFLILGTRNQIGHAVRISDMPTVVGLLAFLWVAGVSGLTLARSIAHQKLAQASNQEARAELAATLKAIPAFVWIAHDPECRNITGNAEAQSLLEIPSGTNVSATPSQPSVRTFKEYLNGKPLPPDQLPMQRAVATRRPVIGAEIDIVLTRGGVHHLYGNAVPLFDSKGAVTGCVGVFLDITERKVAQQALSEREERFRIVASRAPVGIFQSDTTGDAIYVNESWCAIAGLTPEQSMGKGWLAAVHPDDRAQVAAGWEEAVLRAEPSTAEFRFLRPHGKVVWVQGSAVPLRSSAGVLTGYIGSVVDVSGIKQAEQAVRGKEAELQLIADLTPVMLLRCNRDMRYVFVNRSYARRFGLTPAEIIGKPVPEIIGDDAFEATLPHVGIVLGGEPVEFEMELPYKGIGPRYMHFSYVPDTDEQGNVIGLIGAVSDITARRRAEDEVHRNEALLRSITDSSSDMIFVKDRQSRIIFMNPAGLALVGLTLIDVLGRTDEELGLDPAQAAGFMKTDRRVIESRSTETIEEVLATSAGKRLVLLTTKAPRFDATGNIIGVIGVSRDITARKEVEEELRRLNDELEQRVAARTTTLRQTNEDLNREIAERHRLEGEILVISEREQRRLGEDLHERLGSQLAGMGFLCGVLAGRLQTDAHPQAGAAEELNVLIQQSLDSARNLARSSYPVELETGGLFTALQGLADRTSQIYDISCELRRGQRSLLQHDSFSAIHIYRIIQEAVTNAIKHGRARHIIIECAQEDSSRIITVTDDGAGFEADGPFNGMGLHLMRHRARLIGAEIEMRRPENGGCAVICTFKSAAPGKQP